MTTSFPSTSTNPHIVSLEAVFAESSTSIEWLVIAHNDARMVRSLATALSGQAAAVVEVAQDTWDFEDHELSETIDWALQQGAVKHVVLAGHSQAGGSAIRASHVAPQAGVEQSSRDPLIAGVQRTNARNRDAQTRFASQVQQMAKIPVVQSRWTAGELAVYGLFYRAESGCF